MICQRSRGASYERLLPFWQVQVTLPSVQLHKLHS